MKFGMELMPIFRKMSSAPSISISPSPDCKNSIASFASTPTLDAASASILLSLSFCPSSKCLLFKSLYNVSLAVQP